MATLSPILRQATPVDVDHASRSWIHATDVKKYLDFTTGPGSHRPGGRAPERRLDEHRDLRTGDSYYRLDSEDKVLHHTNDNDWGLVGCVFPESMEKAMRFSAELEVGMVGSNTGLVYNPAAPFGGNRQSGLEREGGKMGIDEFLEYKYTAVAV